MPATQGPMRTPSLNFFFIGAVILGVSGPQDGYSIAIFSADSSSPGGCLSLIANLPLLLLRHPAKSDSSISMGCSRVSINFGRADPHVLHTVRHLQHQVQIDCFDTPLGTATSLIIIFVYVYNLKFWAMSTSLSCRSVFPSLPIFTRKSLHDVSERKIEQLSPDIAIKVSHLDSALPSTAHIIFYALCS